MIDSKLAHAIATRLPIAQQPVLDPPDPHRDTLLHRAVAKTVEPAFKLDGALDAEHCRLYATRGGVCQGRARLAQPSVPSQNLAFAHQLQATSTSDNSHNVAYPEPPSSKSAVKRAGQFIAAGNAADDSFLLVDRWRAAHGYVINTFQAWLKGHIGKQEFYIEFAQRLKRRNTVFDKLTRRNANNEPLIADVSAMHDFAGCRMIFNDIQQLETFREYIHSSQVMRNVEHTLRHDLEKYNYIDHPKSSGYRGIHDVYRHCPRGSTRREEKKPWDGLLVELQYRTRAQHAWATAVEISDLLDGERTKFELDTSERGRFFAIASEIIARRHENLANSFADVSTEDLQTELQSLENKLGILRRLELLKQFEDEESLQNHNVLNIYRKDDGSLALEVLPFKAAAPAIAKATELEASDRSVNAVYVRSDNPKQLRSAYRNYFYDPVDFVHMIQSEGGL